MNHSQITAFQAVMTSPTLSEAAKKLGRTQPAISAAIKTLEDQLGLPLFHREGRKLVPVPEAQYLLTEVDSILAQMTRVRATMRSLGDGSSGTLNVAVMPGPLSVLFPQFLSSQISEESDILVTMSARNSNQIAELARAQNIDFGFGDAPGTEDPETDTLYEAEFISAACFVVIPADHALAARDQIAIADLHEQPMGALLAAHEQQQNVRRRFAACGASYRAMVQCQTFLPIVQFIAAGQCCSIFDPLTVAHVTSVPHAADGIAVRPMTDPIRYRYALLAPRYRPVSVLATRLRHAWRDEVLRLLDKVNADPVLER